MKFRNLLRRSLLWLAVSLSASLAASSAALAQAQVQPDQVGLMFYNRPPYMIAASDGSASGLSASPAEQAFKSAHIAYGWNRLSASRILEIVRENNVSACGVGWFKTEERQRFAKFTKTIYRDRPQLAITPKKLVLDADISLRKLLGNKDIRVLVKDGFSYGPALDTMLRNNKSRLISTQEEVVQMVQMIKANRADLTFLPEEEAQYLLEQAGFRADDFNLVRFPDAPQGEKRYIMCSKKVPDAFIRRLNAVIPGRDD
ncbi:MAG: hypothetical protein RL748_2827 [Pseudomonadota bacterium]|jgi:polar amino acid transport system substrate-binding protein